MSSRDKLDEARFFLDKLANANNDKEFRYYLSAFVTAWRSVTFTLQATYRGHYGDKFNEWYEGRCEQLRKVPYARDFVDLRNAMQKEGNVIPLKHITARLPDGNEISATWDLSKAAEGLIRYGVKYAPGKGLRFPADYDPQADEELPRLLIGKASDLLRGVETAEILRSGYQLSLNKEELLTRQELVAACRALIDALAEVVGEAEEIFGIPGIWPKFVKKPAEGE